MESCDVLIVGGGPAGSACAGRLRRAGLDVAVMDQAIFPRDKVCAGWITPQVVEELQIDVDEYRARRTFQPITGFRIGLVGREEAVEVRYGHPVSYGILRCEFDHYLLQRSGARLRLGERVSSIRRDDRGWIVNEAVRASMLVGAGGHFCAVSRFLNGVADRAGVIAAQEAECLIDPARDRIAVDADRPELYFCPDLGGYGWCFRKQGYLNVGFGRFDARTLPRHTADFVAFLAAQGRLSAPGALRWRGHAYRVFGSPRRRLVDTAVVLVGDAAGLAYAESGEGIRPAIESGLLAASTIIESGGNYARDRLQIYDERIRERFDAGVCSRAAKRLVSGVVSRAVASHLLRSRWFVRHVVLDRWFLHAQAVALH